MVAHEAPTISQWRLLLASAPRLADRALHAARPLWQAILAGLLVGGVLVAPVLAALAVVGLFVPQLTGAHRAAPALIFVSLLWLALAIFGAHTQVDRPPVDESDPEHS